MALKTDYQDAMFDGNRKYHLTENDDGTVSLVDATAYTQEGDMFGANDINETNEELNRVADHAASKDNPHGVTAEQVGALSHNDIVPIKNGGTDASDRENAFFNLTYFGNTPITSTDDDTVTNWTALGNGFCGYATSGHLIDQPSTYGYLVSYTSTSSELIQIWYVRPTGVMYVRGGNASGWSGTWKKVFDNSQTIPVTNGGTGRVSLASGAALIGNGTGEVNTKAITDNTSAATCSGANIPTCNTVAQHVAAMLNRNNGVHQAGTGYTTYMARAIALVTSAPSSLTNGCCAFVYQ